MRLHPRHFVVADGRREFYNFVLSNEKWKALTEAEQIQTLLEYVQQSVNMAIRDERHPNNPDQPAGLE